MSAPSEPLPWLMLPGSPADLVAAQIKLMQANLNWRSSFTSELFDGVVTFSHDELVAAEDEFRAATKRHHEWLRRRADQPRRIVAESGAAHELEFYGDSVTVTKHPAHPGTPTNRSQSLPDGSPGAARAITASTRGQPMTRERPEEPVR